MREWMIVLMTFCLLSVVDPAYPHGLKLTQNSTSTATTQLTKALIAAIETGNDKEFMRQFEAAAKEVKNSKSGAPTLAATLERAVYDVPMKLLAKDEFQRAASMAEQLLMIAEKTFGSDHVLVAKCLIASAEVAHEAGDLAGASNLAMRANSLATRIYGTDDTELYYLFNLLGRINHSQGKYEESEACFRHAISEHLQFRRRLSGRTIRNSPGYSKYGPMRCEGREKMKRPMSWRPGPKRFVSANR